MKLLRSTKSPARSQPPRAETPWSQESRATGAALGAPSVPLLRLGAPHRHPPPPSTPKVPGPHSACKLSQAPELHSLPRGSPSQPTDSGAGWQACPLGNPLPGLGIHSRQQLLPRSGRRWGPAAPGDDVRRRAAKLGPRREAGGTTSAQVTPRRPGQRASRGAAEAWPARRFAP